MCVCVCVCVRARVSILIFIQQLFKSCLDTCLQTFYEVDELVFSDTNHRRVFHIELSILLQPITSLMMINSSAQSLLK